MEVSETPRISTWPDQGREEETVRSIRYRRHAFPAHLDMLVINNISPAGKLKGLRSSAQKKF